MNLLWKLGILRLKVLIWKNRFKRGKDNGFFKRSLGFFERKEKVLAFADYSYSFIFWRSYCFDKWLRYCAFYLYDFLKES